jgi:hypothetical protein
VHSIIAQGWPWRQVSTAAGHGHLLPNLSLDGPGGPCVKFVKAFQDNSIISFKLDRGHYWTLLYGQIGITR